MNIKRLLLAFIAVFVFIFLFEWVFHGVLLKETYAQTSSLWRPEAEMQGLFAWMLVGQATIALMFVILFARGFGGRGVSGGIELGVLVALLRIGLDLTFYVVQPLPGKLIVCWAIGGLIEGAVAGAIAGGIYKTGTPTVAATPEVRGA